MAESALGLLSGSFDAYAERALADAEPESRRQARLAWYGGAAVMLMAIHKLLDDDVSATAFAAAMHDFADDFRALRDELDTATP